MGMIEGARNFVRPLKFIYDGKLLGRDNQWKGVTFV